MRHRSRDSGARVHNQTSWRRHRARFVDGHGFVKQSGGHIRIYSELGQGTTVKIYLPRYVRATALAAAPTAIEPQFRAPVHAKASETVLVVEDNEGVLEFAVSVLEDLGYRVLSARNGPKAFGLIH